VTSWTRGVRREVLPNGLTLLVQRHRSARVAAVVTHVKAGFFDEPDRWVGISHVLEHMFFKGTPSRGVGAIARETKAAGGYLNAATSYDHTTYFAVLPAENIATAIAVQADALQHALIDPNELARELRVIIQEARRKLDTPAALTQETLHEVMFDRHRMRRWRIGREADLERLTQADVAGYYRSRYVPERTIVSIVGGLNENDIVQLAREAYGGWPAVPGAVDPSPPEPDHRGVRWRTLRGDVLQSELALGWRGVPALDPDAVPLDLAAAVLGAGRGSWLYRALRETGLTTSVTAHHYSPTELGVFAISAEFEAGRLGAVLTAVGDAVARLVADGLQSEDLERARALLLTSWSRSMEGMEQRAAALAGAEALEGIDLLDRHFAQLSTATLDDVRNAARRVLTSDGVSAVAYQPRDRGEDLDQERLASAFAQRRPASKPEVAGARAVLRPPTTVSSSRVGRVFHTALPGFDLLIASKTDTPLVTLGAYLPRLSGEPPVQAGLSALMLRSAVRGAGGWDAAALAFGVERLGGAIRSSVTHDWLGIGATVLNSHLGDAAGLLRLILTEPTFAPDQVAAERTLLVEETTQLADDMFRYPFQLAFGAAYGDREYGLPASGLPETLGRLSPEDVRRWHETALLGSRGLIVAVGDIAPDRSADVLAGVFEGFGAPQAVSGGVAVSWAVDHRPLERVVERAKTQTALALAFPGPSRSSPERYAAEVWAAIGSGLGGRLFEALRDRRSLAYTVLLSSWQKRRSGALVGYIATAPEREGEARAAMLDELNRFATQPVAVEELQRARNYLSGQVEVERQSGTALAAEIAEAWLAGGGLTDLEEPGARYRAVTAEQIMLLATRTLSEPRAEGVVRGTAAAPRA
jgi:zinc protease